MRFAAGQAVAVLYSVIQLFGYLRGQLVRPIADIVTEFDLLGEWTAACRRIGDSFEEPSAAVGLELAESELWMCSAAWLATVAALDLGRTVKVETKWDLGDKFGKAA